ncbi:MAG: hypothetical protein GTO23_08635 [Nitrososphaeria archaeon]|nr:hypothetical protein [Nitrososphaeria archaeon]
MRTYIFTDRERRMVQNFLGGRIGMTDRDLSKIRSRIKTFDRLKNDVFVYLELYDRILLSVAESSST